MTWNRRSTRLLGVLIVMGLLAALAPSFGTYDQTLGITIAGYLILAIGWNLSAGYGGQVSLGVAAFVGVGGYASGVLLLHTGLDWELSILAGGVGGMLLGLIMAVPLLRLRGDYFTVGTLALALVLAALAQNWQWVGASSGLLLPLNRIPAQVPLLRAGIVAVAVALVVALLVRESRFGLRLIAIRDDEGAAGGLGVPVFRHRLAVLVIAAGLWGIGGAIVSLQSGTASPTGSFDFGWTLSAVLMVVVGGTATFFGPIIGVFIVYYGLTEQLSGYQTLASVIEGALLIVIVRFAPTGVWPLVARHAPTAWRTVRSIAPGSRYRPAGEGPASADV